MRHAAQGSIDDAGRRGHRRAARAVVRGTGAAAVVAAVLAGSGTLASAAPTSFTAGDLAVYRVGTPGGPTPSSASGAVFLDDYSPTGVPSGFSVALPTADSGSTHALTESGQATYDGELTLSTNGQDLVATGYDTAPGTSKVTSFTGARTVAVVSTYGSVDTSTSLADATTDGNNFRAAASVDGSTLWVGGGGGAGVAADGGTSVSYTNNDNVHQLEIVGGNLYESTTKSIVSVGFGLPSAGSDATDNPLIANPPKGFEPAGFALVALAGQGSIPDTMYVADTGNNALEKFSLVNGSTWTLTGSLPAPNITGVAAAVNQGVASVYVTDATSTSVGYNDLLSSVADSSGLDGTLAGALTTLATAPSGESFKGVTFAPQGGTPVAALPESPAVVLLPVIGVVAAGGVVIARRRRRAA